MNVTGECAVSEVSSIKLAPGIPVLGGRLGSTFEYTKASVQFSHQVQK